MTTTSLLVRVTVLCWLCCNAALAQQSAVAARTRFEISYASSVDAGPITGRVFVILASSADREPRQQAGTWSVHTPFFSVDVNALAPGANAVIDSATPGYPDASLKDVPAGDYYVQALMNVYTEFYRADGHTIWAHMDQWEGQHWNTSPGNLVSEPQRVHLDPAAGYNVKLSLTRVLPPIQVSSDTAQVKHIKFESKLLSKFWGHPIYLGAIVLLPKDYDQHPDVYYPVIYGQGHFGLKSGPSADWNSANFPRMISVSWQHPTPYFDDSYAVNSVNNGPYDDAIMQELIPYLETHFRIIRKPYARVLTGGSTGGWEALALQLYHPDFYGGAWVISPDPIDFHRYQMVDIYKDDNAFLAPGYTPPIPEMPMERNVEGLMDMTMRQMSQLESVLGGKSRSGQQFAAWEAAYGPTDAEGYPAQLWDKHTGNINHDVANYMRDHGYDLEAYAEQNWSKIGPSLIGKINIYCGDMDNYYLNLAVYRFEDFMKKTQNPHYEGHFEYGRPMKGHGWSPFAGSEKLRAMANRIVENAPSGENPAAWHY